MLTRRLPQRLDALPPIADLLAEHGVVGQAEDPFPNDGWSGSRLTSIRRGRDRLVLKRTSWTLDWIVRATDDRHLREAWVVAGAVDVPLPPVAIVDPYLGAAADGDAVAMLMRDLSDRLFAWEAAPISAADLDAVLGSIASLHGTRWWRSEPAPWCPIERRLTLLAPAAAVRYRDEGLPVGQRFLDGWAAFDRLAPDGARDLVARLAADVSPLVAALERLPAVGLHGDLKLANVALEPGLGVALIDWQMTLRAPVAVELGWLLVANVSSLPEPPESVMDRYRRRSERAEVLGDWDGQVDLAAIVGLLLRGWRKGLDAEAGAITGWGAGAGDDLAWWCERAVEAADRHL